MQTFRKRRWVPTTLMLIVLTFSALSVMLPSQQVSAATLNEEWGCSYEYSAGNDTIVRDGCDVSDELNGNTFKSTSAAHTTYRFTGTRNGTTCTSQIAIPDTTKPGDGKFSGDTLSPNTGINSCVNVNDSATGPRDEDISIATSGTTNTADPTQSAQLSAAISKFDALMDKYCKSDESLPSNMQYCHDGWRTAITKCFNQVFPKIDPNDKDANKKFNNRMAECLLKEINKPPKKQEVIDALGGNAYSDIVAAGEAATNTADDEDADACNASGNPLTWIICPIFDGFGSLSDFLLHSVVEDFLKTDPISTSRLNADGTSNGVYKAWSAFRVWGDIFLVIALLIIVFGESIGGGLIDAYSAKKILPRLLIAAILINLSLYIVAVLVDVTNIVGQSIGNIIVAPFGDTNLTPSGWKLGLFAGAGALVGAAAAGGLIVAFISAASVTAVLGPFVPFLLLFIIMPVLFAIALVFITLIFRKAIILALILIAPVAFALYCLPNTEKYFRQWWDLLFKTLMIYPIVMIIFAVADVLAYTSIQANGSGSFWGYMVAFLLQFLPLFLIPYAFKVAGGVIGNIHNLGSGIGKRGMEAVKGNANDPTSFRNRFRKRATDQVLQGRAGIESRTRGSRVGAIRRAGGLVGGGPTIQERVARLNQEDAQRVGTIWGNGDDSHTKASTLFHSKNALRGTARHMAANAAGNTTGQEQFQTADGSWFTESVINDGHAAYGRNHSMMQENFKQLLAKTEPLNAPQQNQVLEDYMDWATGEGLDGGTATGRWQGISIPKKDMRLDLRRANISRNPATGRLEHLPGAVNRQALATEFSGMAQHEMIKETPASFRAVQETIVNSFTPGAAMPGETRADQATAVDAYDNLKRYVEGAVPAGVAAAGAVAGGGAAGAGYSTSGSAAAKNATAAREALDQVHAALGGKAAAEALFNAQRANHLNYPNTI